MKKLFTYLGISTLVCLSFIITEQTTSVVKENDILMQEIKEKSLNYNIAAIDAIITDNTIIPGINGKEVDIEKSYNEMKALNQFNDKYLKYKETKPTVTLKKQYDKYIIGGNPQKNMVSLIFLVYENDDITNIIRTLEDLDIKATFFVEGKWFENNNELVLSLIKKGHTVGNLSYSQNYEDSGYVWMNNILKKIGKQKTNYCYYTGKETDLKACANQKNYTIKPSIIIKDNPLIEIKQNLKKGSLIELKINNKVNQELSLVINYIKQKGYQIENLENHMTEKNN